jgi:hypothetical protein
MKKETKNLLLTILFILIGIAIVFLVISLTKKPANTDANVAKCIGKNSVLYVQLGCHACEIQKNIFGDNYQYLNKIDCFYEPDKCTNITATPTWTIKSQNYVGVQTVEKLKELTGC